MPRSRAKPVTPQLATVLSANHNSAKTTKSKMIGYIVALLPLYIFVYLPLSSMIFGTSQKPSIQHATFNSSLIATDDGDQPLSGVSCPSHDYNTFILSREPLIIYVEKFLSSDESKHLLDIRYTFSPRTQSNSVHSEILTRD